MYRLKLLGGVLLDGPDGPVSGRATQQRRLALLALVGSAGDRGRSRDQLISFLWPETDSVEARQHLSHSLYSLRQALGQESIRTAGEYVRLSSSHVQVDALAFELALTATDRAAAAELYAGPFMDGFFVDDAPEFEHWVDSERRRLASLYGRAIEALAQEALAQADHGAAAKWWERLVAHDPYNSAAVVHLMEALSSAGDPANAIQYADDHVRLLDEEFGMGPPGEIVGKVEELRGGSRASLGVVFGSRPEAQRSGAAEPMAEPTGKDHRFGPWPAAIGVVAAMGLAVLWSMTTSPASVVEFIPNAVMVRQVENLTGDSTLDGLGRFAAYVIEGGLSGIDTVRVVTAKESNDIRTGIEQVENVAGVDLTREMARQMHAGLMVESSYYVQGDSLLFEARLIDSEGGLVLQGMQASAVVADPGAGLQALSDQVLVAVATRLDLGEQYSTSYGRGLSYQAWQEVDAARDIWAQRGREREAFDLLYRALEIDSTFDAALGLAMIWHQNFGEFAESDSIAALLSGRTASLPPRQRWQLAVNRAVLRRDRAAMVEAFRDWKDRLPNASRWLHLASSQDVARQPHACLQSLDEVDLEGSRYATSDWMWLLYASCHRALGDDAASHERAREGREKFPSSRNLVIEEVLALSALGRLDEASRLIANHVFEPASGETFEHERVFALLVDSGLEMRSHGYRDAADAALRRAVAWYEARSEGDSVSVADRWRLARALYAAGRWQESYDVFSELSGGDLKGNPEFLSHNVDVSLAGYRAALAARLGDSETAARLEGELAEMRRSYLWGHATYWRAALAAVRADSALATELLDRAMTEGLFAQPWGTEYPKWDFHIDPDFESVRDYEPFRELIAPRG